MQRSGALPRVKKSAYLPKLSEDDKKLIGEQKEIKMSNPRYERVVNDYLRCVYLFLDDHQRTN